jgi:hypothetical protein
VAVTRKDGKVVGLGKVPVGVQGLGYPLVVAASTQVPYEDLTQVVEEVGALHRKVLPHWLVSLLVGAPKEDGPGML